ncbi:MAG: hypothetical protein ACI9EW_001923 [Cellvibrionaceae bacterium]|jgi:hypothetical protein
MTTIETIRTRHISLMRKSIQTLGNVIQGLTLEQAITWRDSGDGWTITEVMCHLRDFDVFFYGRAEMMVALENPKLPAYDHIALARDLKYNDQNVFEVYKSLRIHREKFAQFFDSLEGEQWDHEGQHPERDSFTMLDSLMQVGLHDNDHLEQMTRIIAEKVSQ